MFNKFFFRKSCRLWDHVEKYFWACQATDDNIRRMHTECWITKATNINSEYVILAVFPLHQWLHERAIILRFTYISCLVSTEKDNSPHQIGTGVPATHLTPDNRILLEKLRVPQLLKKYPVFYGAWIFIAVFIRPRPPVRSWSKWLHYTSSHLRLGLPNWSFLQLSSTTTLTSFLCYACHMPHAHVILREVQKLKFFTLVYQKHFFKMSDNRIRSISPKI